MAPIRSRRGSIRTASSLAAGSLPFVRQESQFHSRWYVEQATGASRTSAGAAL